MEKQIEAEMLEIIEKSREEWSHDVTDHTENEYIREGLFNAGYRKQSEVALEIIGEILSSHTPDIDGFFTMHELELANLKNKYLKGGAE